MYVGSYSPLLVLASLVVAFLAAYTALDMASRIAAARGRAAFWWLAGGACVMGLGIWSMHFVGMLAFSLPIQLGYDPLVTLASLLIAIASSGFGLWLIHLPRLPWLRLAGGAVLMGAGVAGMHYTGMAAMQMMPAIDYDPARVAQSVAIAIVASGAALWVAFHLRSLGARVRLWRVGAAAAMGCAIAGMHYTGMAAARFPVGSICGAAPDGLHPNGLAPIIGLFTAAVLGIALVVSFLDRRQEERNARLTASLASANRDLAYLALHDNLTKLPNRVMLSDRIGQAMSDTDVAEGCFALMFIDLDGFKMVNDLYGHHTGDKLLVQAIRRINELVLPQDTLARVGGDEFVLLHRVRGIDDARATADSLLRCVRQPYAIDAHELRVSASIGIVMYPQDGATESELLIHADAAMYHAKSMGRNTHSVFQASMNTEVRRQFQLIQDLRAALERNELELHYQPKFNSADERMMGAEALLRWRHPELGLLTPDSFIPVAEKAGLIVPIGEWVFNEACRQLVEWQRTGCEAWVMAINLSTLQFNHAGLVQMVRTVLEQHQLNPKCLTLEVAESVAMQDADASIKILQQLYDLGVNISIDDFGTGYSSLLYLKQMPGSELKIDRSVVRDLAHHSEGAAIVSAMVTVGRTLNLKIVAEGIETEAQQEFLTQVGCDELQGFRLGRPMPAVELQARYQGIAKLGF